MHQTNIWILSYLISETDFLLKKLKLKLTIQKMRRLGASLCYMLGYTSHLRKMRCGGSIHRW